MKRKLLLAALCVVGALGMRAQGTWTAPAVPGVNPLEASGDLYLYNIQADAFVNYGMNWNTQACATRLFSGDMAASSRHLITVAVQNGNQTFKMSLKDKSDKTIFCGAGTVNDVWTDNTYNNVWTPTASTNYTNAYTLKNSAHGDLLLDVQWIYGGRLTFEQGQGFNDWAFIPAASITDGSYACYKERRDMYAIYQELVNTENTETYATQLQAANNVYTNANATKAELRAATRTLLIAVAPGIENPVNANALFTNADILGNNTIADWGTSFNVTNGVFERWHTTYTLSQSQTDLPNGLYDVTFHGLWRQDDNKSQAAPHLKVTGTNVLEDDLKTINTLASQWNVSNGSQWTSTGLPDHQIPANQAMTLGDAVASINNVQVKGNSLAIELAITGANQWVLFQGFDIVYNGSINTALYKKVVAAKAEAETYQSYTMSTEASTALSDAISTANNLSSNSETDDLNAALTALTTAIEGVKTSNGLLNALATVKSTTSSLLTQLSGNSMTNAYNELNTIYENIAETYATDAAITTATSTLTAANTTAQSLLDAYAAFDALKVSANAIAGVAYTETTNGSHDTFTGAITAQTTAAQNATTADAITSATAALTAAIKTYIAGAEPANDGEYFDITCLMVNPNFDDSHNGWTYQSAPGVNWSNCEYYEKEFDINQTVTGLPTGSYSLSVQAFQRPGWAGSVYDDYVGGTDNASSVLYINSITSNVKNIAADAQNNYLLGDGTSFAYPNDSRVGTEGSYKYLPNSQQGANLYFAAGFYDATCAAVVDEAANGSLKLGFKSTKDHVAGDWTIFDNFRLYYYGSSLLVYYKQYLPQLRAEVAADLSNGAYTNVLVSSEDEALDAALAADPASETEEAYETVINNLKAAKAAFRAAATSYDAMVAAKESTLTKIETNIGTGVFQYDADTNNNLYSAYETAKSNVTNYSFSTSSTAADAQDLVDDLNTAVSNYQNQALNAPDAGTHYNLVVATSGHAKNGNAVIIVPGSTSANNLTGYGLNANYAINANLAQAVTFTQVSGNIYNISFETADGTAYLTYGTTNGSAADHKNYQIQATTDATKKGEFKIAATATDNVFNIYNTLTNSTIACQSGGNIYTEAGNADFSVAEASQASVTVSAKAGKYGTTILPFTPNVTGVKFYSISELETKDDVQYVKVEEVATPAANVPYLIKNNGTSDFSSSLSGWGTAAATSYTAGLLTGVYTSDKIAASVEPTAEAAGTYRYVLQTQETQAFYKVASDGDGFTATANKAYLSVSIPAIVGGNAKERIMISFEGDATAINALEVLTSGEYDAIYNAAGAKMDALQKGVNIIKKGGKTYKIFVK